MRATIFYIDKMGGVSPRLDRCSYIESCEHYDTVLCSGNYKGCGFYKAYELEKFLEEKGYGIK